MSNSEDLWLRDNINQLRPLILGRAWSNPFILLYIVLGGLKFL